MLALLGAAHAGRAQVAFTNAPSIYLTADALAGYMNGATACTVCAWVQIIATNQGYVVSIPAGPVGGVKHMLGLEAYITGGVWRAVGRSRTNDAFQTAQSTAQYAVGPWYHVAGVLDFAGDAIRIYVDGALDSSTAVTFGSDTYVHTASAEKPRIGSRYDDDSAFRLNGILADVRLYVRQLSAQEIATIYRQPWALAVDPKLVLRACCSTRMDTWYRMPGPSPRNYTAYGPVSSNLIAATYPEVRPHRFQLRDPVLGPW
jgi:hypothetical protein